MLSNTQNLAKDKIIDKLSKESNDFLHLYGPNGSGKSTILKYVKSEIEKYENWNVFYIEGQLGHYEPYSTIKSILNRKIVEVSTFTTSIGSGLSIIPGMPSLLNFTTSIGYKIAQKYNTELNFFINYLKKGMNQNILIIADEFEKWDISSQKFLLILKEEINKQDFKNKNIRIIFSTMREKDKLPDGFFTISLNKIKLSSPKLSDIVEITKSMDYSNLKLRDSDLDYMMMHTGGDLHLLNDWIEAYNFYKTNSSSNDTAILDISSLLEYRLEMVGESQTKLKLTKLLTTSSIFDNDFKLRELQYLCEEIENIDEFVELSCEKLFLKKGDELSFSNQTLKDWFYKKLEYKSSSLHEQYAQYLQKYKPENYLSRAIHSYKADDRKTKTREILSLYFLAYIRNIEKSNVEDSQHIYQMIREIVERDLPEELNKHTAILDLLKIAYDLYFKEEYQTAFNTLKQISTGFILFDAEIARLRVLFALMSDMDTNNIETQVKRLEKYLPRMKDVENEQWLQSAFALFSTYSNKLGDFDKSEELGYELLIFTSANADNPLYAYAKNILKRKSFIFESSDVTKTHMAESVEYFERTSDYVQYYFALCNFSGILLVLGEFEWAINHLEKCLELITEYDHIQFPSQQKIYNNLYLARLFKNYFYKPNRVEDDLQKIIIDFESHISPEQSEKNAIMIINLINLYLLQKDFGNAHRLKKILQEEVLVNNVDDFYKYYYSNFEFIENILQSKWNEANLNLDYMKNNPPSFHKKNKPYFDNRHNALAKLLEKQQPVAQLLELNDWVYQNSKKKDSASGFYSRLFLFSDLQFSSL